MMISIGFHILLLTFSGMYIIIRGNKSTTQGGSTYYIIYWDHGDGIIFYNYIILKDAKLPFTAAELIELILKGVSNALIGAVVGVGAGALGADLDEAFRRKIMKE